MNSKLPVSHPFNSLERWYGSFMGDPSCSQDLDEKDIDRVLWMDQSRPTDWDGSCGCIVLMQDGRYVTWESSWGPTGDGFSVDAYGGDADVHICRSLNDALLYGLSPVYRDKAAAALNVAVSAD